jgi:hypothetical protein
MQRTHISDDDELPTTVATDAPVRRTRKARALFLLALPVVFVLAGVGGWYLFGQ